MSCDSISRCAHCRGKAELRNTRKNRRVSSFFVECTRCGIRTRSYGSYRTAIAIWNRRPDDIFPEGLKAVYQHNKDNESDDTLAFVNRDLRFYGGKAQ